MGDPDMTRSSFSGALAALALVGCAGAGAQSHPVGAAGTGWRELATDHFVLRTDVSSDIGRRVIGELELDRALLAAAMPALAAVQRRTEVVAFASREEYWEATGQKTDYVGNASYDALGDQRIVLRISATGDIEQHAVDLAHELSHVLTLHVAPRQPVWLAEGLAQYLSSVARVKRGRHFLGALPDDVYPGIDCLPVTAVLAWQRGQQGQEDRLYVSAWRLVRFLATDAPDRLVDFERRLAAGAPEDAAWNAAFPAYPRTPQGLARLERAVRPWGELLPDTWREVQAPAATAEPAERPLDAGEVWAVRLRVSFRGDGAALDRRVEAALRVDPDHVQALTVAADRNPEVALSLGRRAVAAHPGDAAAWRLVGRALWGKPEVEERERALRRAVELDPANPEALALLAELLTVASPAEAESLASRARALAPWSPFAGAAHAAAAAQLGRCDGAAAEVRAAAALAAAQGLADASSWKRRVVWVDQRCAAGSPGVDGGRTPSARSPGP
jgi:hypothetical protein